MSSHSPASDGSNCVSEARPRILIVDDVPANIQTLYEVIQEEGEVFLAVSGRQALTFCADTPPDLVLLDVMMPEMDGYEVCRRLKADPDLAAIPVIFVTGKDTPADELRALEAGGVDFITKPVVPAVARARVRTHLTLKAQRDFLRSLSMIDGLTGVANRRAFDQAVVREWRHCQRVRSPLSVMMVDIDHFKLFNDQYGHQQGDACLKAVASILARDFGRAHDLVARYGGEEFVCLMPDTDLAAARRKADMVCAAIGELALPHAGSPTAPVVTVSIGVAAAIPDDASRWNDLILAADRALYQAKGTGRNRVCPQMDDLETQDV
jgi:diguanylate cyclase (GGDEF)-like protein